MSWARKIPIKRKFVDGFWAGPPAQPSESPRGAGMGPSIWPRPKYLELFINPSPAANTVILE